MFDQSNQILVRLSTVAFFSHLQQQKYYLGMIVTLNIFENRKTRRGRPILNLFYNK